MDRLFRVFFSCLFVLMIAGCAADGLHDFFFPQSDEDVQPPRDQATTEERFLIDAKVEQIQNLMRELGSQIVLNEIPIVVSKEDASQTHRWGYCQYKANGKPSFIVITKAVFQQEKYMAKYNTSALFSILLHEIGHCYLGRAHSNESVSYPGFYMQIRAYYWDRVAHNTLRRNMASFPVSVMSTGAMADVPYGMEKYFVAEVLGKDKLQSITDLRKYLEVRLLSYGN